MAFCDWMWREELVAGGQCCVIVSWCKRRWRLNEVCDEFKLLGIIGQPIGCGWF